MSACGNCGNASAAVPMLVDTGDLEVTEDWCTACAADHLIEELTYLDPMEVVPDGK